MVALAQVAVEYGALTSDNAATSSFPDLLDRITEAASTEDAVMGLGAILVVYVVKRLIDAF